MKIRNGLSKLVLLLITLVVLIVPAVYTNTIYGYIPAMCFITLITLSFVYVQILKRSIDVLCSGKEIQVHKGEKIQLVLNIKNDSFLVCNKVRAEVFITTNDNRDMTSENIVVMIDSKGVTDFSFDITMSHIGLYEVGIKNVRIFDPFCLFYSTIPMIKATEVVVLPSVQIIETNLIDNLFSDAPNANRYMENDGFDYTGVREYAIGDSIKKIHWKLSAHTSLYMTKVNEVGLRSDITIIMDTFLKADLNLSRLDIFDKLIETVFSLTNFANEKDVDCDVIYHNYENQLCYSVIKDKNSFVEIIKNVHRLEENCTVQYDMKYISGSNVVICASNLTQELLDLIHVATQMQRNISVYYITDNLKLHDKNYRKVVLKATSFMDTEDINYEIV